MSFYCDSEHNLNIELDKVLDYYENTFIFSEDNVKKYKTRKNLNKEEFKKCIYRFYYTNPKDVVISALYFIDKKLMFPTNEGKYTFLWKVCILVYKVMLCYDHNINFGKLIILGCDVNDYALFENMFLKKINWSFSIPEYKYKEIERNSNIINT